MRPGMLDPIYSPLVRSSCIDIIRSNEDGETNAGWFHAWPAIDSSLRTSGSQPASPSGSNELTVPFREEVPPSCVTIISAYACRHEVAPAAETVMKLQVAVFGL